jgi:hypothetical protein
VCRTANYAKNVDHSLGADFVRTLFGCRSMTIEPSFTALDFEQEANSFRIQQKATPVS